ncbi:hypothetical protein AN948_06755 [Rhodococcus sp. ADH]|nr:hypothetical protein AN948_06755 [Rhodococcus sp. ADH]
MNNVRVVKAIQRSSSGLKPPRHDSIGFVMDSVGQWPALSPSEAFEIRNLLKLGHLPDAQPRNGANG